MLDACAKRSVPARTTASPHPTVPRVPIELNPAARTGGDQDVVGEEHPGLAGNVSPRPDHGHDEDREAQKEEDARGGPPGAGPNARDEQDDDDEHDDDGGEGERLPARCDPEPGAAREQRNGVDNDLPEVVQRPADSDGAELRAGQACPVMAQVPPRPRQTADRESSGDERNAADRGPVAPAEEEPRESGGGDGGRDRVDPPAHAEEDAQEKEKTPSRISSRLQLFFDAQTDDQDAHREEIESVVMTVGGQPL